MSEDRLKPFRVEGKFLMGGAWQVFSKEFCAADEDGCAEQAYSVLGSRHGVKRKSIDIYNIEEIRSPNDIRDEVIKDRVLHDAGRR